MRLNARVVESLALLASAGTSTAPPSRKQGKRRDNAGFPVLYLGTFVRNAGSQPLLPLARARSLDASRSLLTAGLTNTILGLQSSTIRRSFWSDLSRLAGLGGYTGTATTPALRQSRKTAKKLSPNSNAKTTRSPFCKPFSIRKRCATCGGCRDERVCIIESTNRLTCRTVGGISLVHLPPLVGAATKCGTHDTSCLTPLQQ